MGNERWRRGDFDGQERNSFDWERPALERGISREQAYALYKQACEQAKVSSRRSVYIYKDLLERARPDAYHPGPAKVTRTMLMAAGINPWRARPSRISPYTGQPIAPTKVTLTSYLQASTQASTQPQQGAEANAQNPLDEAWALVQRVLAKPGPDSVSGPVEGVQPETRGPRSAAGEALQQGSTHVAWETSPLPTDTAVARLEHLFDGLDRKEQPATDEWFQATPGKMPQPFISADRQEASNMPGQGAQASAAVPRMAPAGRPATMPLALREAPNPADRDESRDKRTAVEIAAELSSDPGKPLDADTRARFESALSHDFSQVRVHDSDRAAQAAAELSAEAFTLGRDIYFGRGKLAPGSAAGARLLAHELTHVVQHDQGRLSQPDSETGISPRSSSAEQEAYRNEDTILGRVSPGPEPAHAQDSPAGAAPGHGHAAPAVSAAPATAQGIFRREQNEAATPANATPANATGEEEEQREPTEEELQAMIAQAQREGNSRPAPEPAEPEPVPEEPAVEPAPQENANAGAEPSVDGAGGEGAQPVQLASLPPGPGGMLPAFEALKAGPLAKWDDEVAWHDYFKGGGGPTAGIQIDRGALIWDALSSGGLAGFQAGVKSLAIDTLINMASTKIPYLQGFVEMARIAYDPAAWFESQSQATVGKIANGLDQIWNGDIVDKLEGVVNILDGLNGFLSLASTICWIVAAAGFVISFICPAVIPFVALCANWAVSIGSISTLLTVYISLARVGIIALRAAQMAWFESDPKRLLEQGERLRAQSQAFSQEFTVRAGHNLRGRAQQALERRQSARSNPPPMQRTNTSSGTQPSRMQRIRSAMATGGRLAVDTVAGGFGNVRGAHTEIADRAGSVRNVTQAYRGTGEYAGQGQRTTRQTLADMEHAGATVHHSDAQRQRVDRQLRDQGEGTPVNRERQALTARRDQLQAEHDEAVRRRDAAAAQAQKAKEDAAEAQRNLERARAAHGDTVEAARAHLAAQRRLHTEAESELRLARGVRDRLQELEREASAAGDADRARICRQCIQDQEIRILQSEGRVIQTQANVRIAEADVTIAQHPIALADARARGTQQGVSQSEEAARAAAAAVGPSNDRLNESKVDVNTHDLPGGQTREQAAAAEQRRREYRVITDFTGSGISPLHGHNQGAGETGTGTTLVAEIFDGVKRQEAMAASGGEVHGGPLGAWSRTGQVMNDPNATMDLKGTAGARGQGEDYIGQLRARYERLAAELPAPPREAPNQLDGASQGFADIDEEERQIRFQQEVMTGLMQEGEQCTSALDAVQAISAANQEALTGYQGELETKLTAQDNLEARGQAVQENAGESQNRGQEGQGVLGGFVNRFIELMGMVPSRLVSNAGQGAEGARALDQGVRDQGATAGETNAAGQQTVQEATRMRGETTAAQSNAQQVGQQFQSLDQSVSEEQLAAMDGMTFMQQAMTTSQERLDAIAAEKERLRGEHAGAQSSMTGWIATHEQIRRQGLGELDGLVELVEQPNGRE